MNDARQPAQDEVNWLVDHLFRHNAGQLVAGLTRVFGVDRLELVEEVVQEALIKALRLWPYRGVPENPGGWLRQVARNMALDALRREASLREKLPLLERMGELPAKPGEGASAPLDDDQLTMIFICCHPALTLQAQVTLTLKVVAGFGVSEIAHAFLSSETAIAQRLVRARRSLREQGVDFTLPEGPALAVRLEAVLGVIYLIFNEGYNATQGPELVRAELCAEAIRLASALSAHPLGRAPEVDALLAMMHFHASRLEARLDPEGNLLTLAEQDRTRWSAEHIRAGLRYLELARSGERLSAYHLEAGIAACHAAAASYEATDWSDILFYYDSLLAIRPSPVAALNRAVALAMRDGPEAGLSALETLQDEPELQTYYLLPAAFGELHARAGRPESAAAYYHRALELTANAAERRFLQRKIDRVARPNNSIST